MSEASALGAFLAEFLRDPAFLSRYPYYAAVLSRMSVVADPSMSRMGVSLQNGRVFLHVNVESFQREPQYLRGVLLHEVHHVVLGHLGNPKYADADQPDLMDLALEMSANEHIEEDLPDPITWKQYSAVGIRGGQSTLERYHRLCEVRRGNTSKPVPGAGSPRVDDHRPMNAPARDPGTVEATRQLLRSAFEEAERMLSGKDVSPKSRLVAGRDPGRLLEDLTGHAPPPERPFDWKTAMRMFAAKSRAPVHTYARPNRRFPSRVGEIPGRTYAPRALERPSLLVAIDTSTSMTDRELSEVSRELSVLSEHARVTIVECDVEITRVYAFEGRLESVAGRGGTDLRPVFEADFLGSHRADGVIYFTDGIGPLPETAPRLPVLWVLTKPGELACSWGQKVRLHGLPRRRTCDAGRVLQRLRTSLAVLVLAACAPPPVAPPPPDAPPEPPAPAMLVEPAPPPLPVEPAPTGPIEPVDLADDAAILLAFVDVRALHESELWPAAQPALRVLGWDQVMVGWTRSCGFDPTTAVDQVVISVGDRGGVAIGKLRRDATEAMTCLRRVGGPDEVLRNHVAISLNGGFGVVVDDLLLLGDRRAIEATLDRHRDKARSRSGRALLDRSPGTVVSVVSAPLGGPFGRTDWHARLTADELAFDATLDGGSGAQATAALAMLEKALRTPRLVGDDAGGKEAVADLRRRVKLGVEGAAVTAHLSTRGDAAARKGIIDDLAAVALGAAREERHQRVRSQLWNLSGQLDAYARALDPRTQRPRGRFPPSAPRTPAKMPSGGAVTVERRDFARGTWATVGFVPSSPTTHSFEVVTAPNGRKVTLRAVGDPDGTGDVDTVEMTVELDGARSEQHTVTKKK